MSEKVGSEKSSDVINRIIFYMLKIAPPLLFFSKFIGTSKKCSGNQTIFLFSKCFPKVLFEGFCRILMAEAK